MLLLATLALATPPARAAAPDSATADTTGQAAAAARRAANRFGDQPRIVMLRSLLVPGWGQLHNHAWFKAAAVAGVEGGIIASLLRDQRDLDRLLREVNDAADRGDVAAHDAGVIRYNDVLDRSVGNQWLLAGVLTYALVDAYVDAHFRRFDLEFKTDPALPAGASPDTPSGGGGTGRSARLSLRWHF